MAKWIIMQELEDAHIALPYLIVDGNDEDRAYELSDKLAKENPGFIFWPCLCEEDVK